MIDKTSDFVLFAKVVEAGGFTAASRLTHIPQASISRRIAELENALDVRLIERSTRKISVTDAGARVYQHARAIIESLESAQAVAESIHTAPRGLIRLTAPVILGQYILSSLIADFCQVYPEVTFQVEFTGRRVDLIEEGFDLAVRVGDLQASSLIKMPLISLDQAYFATADIARTIRHPKDLLNANWLHASNDFALAKWPLVSKETGEQVAVFEKNPLIASNDIEVLIRAAENGLGIASLPEFAKTSALVPVLPDVIARQVDISALVVSRKSIVPAIRQFVEFMRERLPASLRLGTLHKQR